MHHSPRAIRHAPSAHPAGGGPDQARADGPIPLSPGAAGRVRPPGPGHPGEPDDEWGGGEVGWGLKDAAIGKEV